LFTGRFAHCGGFFALFSLLLLSIAAPRARAQAIRHDDTPYGSTLTSADNAADAQNRADWPHLKIGESGTQVHITFDPRNADVNLFTDIAFGENLALTEAQRIASEAGYPKADYILNHGTKTLYVDIELNKYLHRPDKSHTDFTLSLGALAAALDHSRLPRPIVLYIDGGEADTTRLAVPGELAAKTRNLGAATFFAPKEISAGSLLRFAVAVPLMAYFCACGFLSLVLGALLVTPIWLGFLRVQTEAKMAKQTAKGTPDPADVQNKYNARRPQWMMRLTPFIGPLVIVLFAGNRRLMSEGFAAIFDQGIPHINLMVAMPILIAWLALWMQGPAWVKRWRTPKSERIAAIPAPLTDGEQREARVGTNGLRFVYPMFAGLLVMQSFLLVPALRQIDPTIRLCGVFGTMGLSIVVAVIMAMRSSRQGREELGPDSEHYLMVHALAREAGVEVRHVVVTCSSSLNAYASIFGTVGVTSALLRKMEPEEIRAIVAHELGHLKLGHTRKGLVIGLSVLGVYLAAYTALLYVAKGRSNEITAAILRTPIFGVLFGSVLTPLVVGGGQRKRETQADQFAVALIGDPELFIRSIRKIHTLDATPHMLKPSDEKLATHPSLAHRIEAIRAAQAEE